jgi:hypothetical protein
MQLRLVVSLLIVAATLAAAFAAGSALAARDRPNAEAADKTLGMAIMAANVNYFDGSLARSSGVVSSTRLVEGRYRVTFARDISQCYLVATTYDAGVGRGFAITWLQSEDHVDIVTCDPAVGCNGSPADHSFQVIAFCPK